MSQDSEHDPLKYVNELIQGSGFGRSQQLHSWEKDLDKTWERVQVDSDGKLSTYPKLFTALVQKHQNNIMVEDLLSESPSGASSGALTTRKPAQSGGLQSKRGMLRSVCLCVDVSQSSLEQDLRPSRLDLLLKESGHFIQAFMEQHPLSELTLFSVASGHCSLQCSSRSQLTQYMDALNSIPSSLQQGGAFSLQNTIHCAIHALNSSSKHSIKEIIVITCSLNTIDCYDIAPTIEMCKKNGIQVHIIGYNARVNLFDTITRQTRGTYTIATTPSDLGEYLIQHVQPPLRHDFAIKRGWIVVCFPSLSTSTHPNELVCVCHCKPQTQVYMCSKCQAPVCQLPSQCPVCQSLLLSYPHLARSAHQLQIPPPTFPVFYPVTRLSIPLTETPQTEQTHMLSDLVKATERYTVHVKSLTFARSITEDDIARYIQQSSAPFHHNYPPSTTAQRTTAGAADANEWSNKYLLSQSSSRVSSPTCVSHVVTCKGCATPVIVPSITLIEQAICFVNNVQVSDVCNCDICTHAELVTSCSLCGCLLCADCDSLIQKFLQNCPGCLS